MTMTVEITEPIPAADVREYVLKEHLGKSVRIEAVYFAWSARESLAQLLVKKGHDVDLSTRMRSEGETVYEVNRLYLRGKSEAIAPANYIVFLTEQDGTERLAVMPVTAFEALFTPIPLADQDD